MAVIKFLPPFFQRNFYCFDEAFKGFLTNKCGNKLSTRENIKTAMSAVVLLREVSFFILFFEYYITDCFLAAF